MSRFMPYPPNTALLRRALDNEARQEFYAHYDGCPKCGPVRRCRLGRALQNEYTIATLAAGVVSYPERRQREQELMGVTESLRSEVKSKAEAMWPRRQELMQAARTQSHGTTDPQEPV